MYGFRVSYSHSGLDCPDCVVPIRSPDVCVADVSQAVKEAIVYVRGALWSLDEVTIQKIEAVGPVFFPEGMEVSDFLANLPPPIEDDPVGK